MITEFSERKDDRQQLSQFKDSDNSSLTKIIFIKCADKQCIVAGILLEQ